MPVGYRVEDDDLLVFDGHDVRWRGRPDGYPVTEVVKVPDSPDAVVLLRYSEKSARAFANLLRVGPDGAIRWRSLPPDGEDEGEDAWVSFRFDKREGLVANSWSGYFCVIDVETGAIRSSEFVK
jgi:hypothetical protein